jgi:uncharacterized protein (TIGR00251 family)
MRGPFMVMFDALRKAENGVQIGLWVQPGADETALVGYDEWKGSFKFKTSALAEKNKANKAVLEFFESLFGRKAALVSGEKSRDKKILVLGATLDEASDIINKELKR